MKLGAYILFHNEQDLAQGCVDHIQPYVDELVLVDHGCTDGTRKILESNINDKTKLITLPYSEPVNMGNIRTQCYQAMTAEWVLAVDADEYYPWESMEAIREFVENPNDAISARVRYKNISWRSGYAQTDFGHFPDRLYKRGVVDRVEGVLPLDMTFVKTQYLNAPNKKKGSIGVLEYDNDDDVSFIHPKQPIIDAMFYHLARSRGYNFELNKNKKYQQFMHPEWTQEQCKEMARSNQWVNGLYDIEPIDIPENIPKQTIPDIKVSVVITNYNYSQWIATAIESVLNQTYPAHEIIVVDDCSTDNSQEIINRYPVIKLFQKENKGVVQCRNWGMWETTGDFIINLDSDDFISPTYIEKVVKKQRETQVQVVFTDMHVFGNVDYDHRYPEFTLQELRINQCIPSVCALMDRHIFSLTGGFREDTIYDDYEFWLRVATKGYDFAQVHEPLFHYNRKSGGRCEENDKRQTEGFEQLRREYGKIV